MRHKINMFILIATVFLSCSKKEEEISPDYLLGNWLGITDGSYTEYFFEDNYFYYYSVSSGNWTKMRYEVRNDSMYRILDFPETRKEKLEFYSILKKFDENQLNTRFETLYRYRDSISLENAVYDRIDYENYDKNVMRRASAFEKYK
ncbi:hypothetical protein NBT05_02540 [Aquimarina sp. ERC-38]|uniref:hypothetical protein n=1 Tax=Aquimarina sp. ERC-38 TaxID=2949996 RepID=UPI002246E22C|nr:hypothetical protein [Aquimarina sp. ERC-38]UZO81360.1 hypothetical protein NBT05_02540 [Aquimarina sp. ERC-38]